MTPDTREATATQNASLNGTTSPQPRDFSAAISKPLTPGVGEATAMQNASLNGTTPDSSDPSLLRDQIFRGFRVHDIPKATLGAPRLGLSMQYIQQRQTYSFSNDFDFWMYRIRKECGPITDQALHADCLRSFKAQYPFRHASRTRGAGDFQYRSRRQSWSSVARQ
ncbi:MAG: hypothetical protein JO320_01430 [Alphaproteobacteria bacterium]|nr:hypothetical protein [Alphaproteobacteria bacterium]MBV9201819.1 hypothetical protein [Alphaproteobacteria bacterium]MBV9373719.1 hypothetical protein [Alphaproteobacteria bacterium]